MLEKFFKEQITETEFQDYLEALCEKGESVDDIVSFATVMRKHMIPVDLASPILDVCGTGGSGQERFNISTASAIILGSMGVPVAKHGNYGSKTLNGSFNFLEALGVPFNHSPQALACLFESHNLCFIFARFFHPAMKRVGPIRKNIGKRTIFNLLGPLCNPASNTHHVLGTTSVENARKMNKAFQELGITKALLVVGANGLDELTPAGTNILIEGNKEWEWESPFQDLEPYPCGDSKENAALFSSVVLRSEADHPLSRHIAISTGAALFTMGNAKSIEEGIEKTLVHIKNDNVAPFLESYINQAKELEQ